jgi:predicted alpha/beta superfamily hydrolase
MSDHGAGVELTGNIVGNIRRLRAVESPQLGNHRDVLVYLPPSYPVTAATTPPSTCTMARTCSTPPRRAGEWQVDETMERIAPEGFEAIVIAVPNMGVERIAEYSPFRDARVGGGRGDAYLAFLIDTLKPHVDRHFRTRRDAEHTGIIGSSMGGLISLYAFLTRPDVFGVAGVMSPSLWFAGGAIFHVADAARHWPGRLYLDTGTAAGRRQVRQTREMVRMLRARRAPASADSLRRARGAGHNEMVWARASSARAVVAARRATTSTGRQRSRWQLRAVRRRAEL